MNTLYLELFYRVKRYINHLNRTNLKLLKNNYNVSKKDLAFIMTIELLSTYTDEKELNLLIYGNSFLNNYGEIDTYEL